MYGVVGYTKYRSKCVEVPVVMYHSSLDPPKREDYPNRVLHAFHNGQCLYCGVRHELVI